MSKDVPLLTLENRTRRKINIYVETDGDYFSDTESHIHTYYTVDIVKSGYGYHNINGRRYRLFKGAVHLVLPCDMHYMSVDPGSHLEMITLRFDESAVDEKYKFALRKLNDELYADETVFTRLCVYAESLAEYLSKSGEYAENAAKMSFNLILTCLSELGSAQNMIVQREDTAVTRALHYIYVHFREDPSLKTTADYVGLAPEYFSSLFKKEIGRNYTEYLTGLKLDFACQTLKSGFSVAEVCFLSGFGSVSNFNSTFKRIKGMTPSDYRKSVDIKCK